MEFSQYLPFIFILEGHSGVTLHDCLFSLLAAVAVSPSSLSILPIICRGVWFYYFPGSITIILIGMILLVIIQWILEMYAKREGTPLWVQRSCTKITNFMDD